MREFNPAPSQNKKTSGKRQREAPVKPCETAAFWNEHENGTWNGIMPPSMQHDSKILVRSSEGSPLLHLVKGGEVFSCYFNHEVSCACSLIQIVKGDGPGKLTFFAPSPRTTIFPLLVASIWNPDLEVVVVSRPQGGVVVKRPTHVTIESKRITNRCYWWFKLLKQKKPLDL